VRSEREGNHGQIDSTAGAEARRSIASSMLRKLAGVVQALALGLVYLSIPTIVLMLAVAVVFHDSRIAETAWMYFVVSGVLYGLMNALWHRQARKYLNSPHFQAALKKRQAEQAEAIQAMQEGSYWLDGTARTEAPLGTISTEVRLEALRLAREHVKKEVRSKGFKPYEVSPAQITGAAKALLAARPAVMIEQAKKNVAAWRSR
jgi:hypothetical protein